MRAGPDERGAGGRVRPAALRLLPTPVPRGQDPDRATPAGGARRARRVLLPRQRPRSTRDADDPAPPRDGPARAPELRRGQQAPAQVIPPLRQADSPRLALPDAVPAPALP